MSRTASVQKQTVTSSSRNSRGKGGKASRVQRRQAGQDQARPAVQPKLQVGKSDDRFEREADRLAGQVMTAPAPGSAGPKKEKEMLRGKGATAGPVSPEFHAGLNATKGGGMPLPESTRSFMEPRFGYDFSAVRVHTDQRAAGMNREINSLAFTHGGNIYFNKGQFDPGSSQGRRLLAHELTHTIQQGAAVRRKEAVSTPIRGGAQGSEKIMRSPGTGSISITGSGVSVVVPVPDLTLFRRLALSRAWSYSIARLPLWRRTVVIPKVGPVMLTLLGGGSTVATLSAGLGPGVLRNISVSLDFASGRYSGRAQLYIPADLSATAMLMGALTGQAHWHGVEIASISGGLMGTGGATAMAAFILSPEVVYDRGNVIFNVGGELDSCLLLSMNISAFAGFSILRAPVWSGRWTLLSRSLRRCWRVGGTLTIGYVGGRLIGPSITWTSEPVPVAEMLPALIAEAAHLGVATAPPPVPVNIRGGSDLWWFNREKPSGYPIEQSLTADTSGIPGTFRWEILRGGGFADYNGMPTAVGATAKLKSKNASIARNDVDIKVSFTGSKGEWGEATRRFTVQAPNSVRFIRNDDHADPTYVYETKIHKAPVDQFGADLPRGVEINEQFTAAPTADFPGMDWRRGNPGGGFIVPPAWHFDTVQGETPSHTPTPVPPTDANAGVAVYHWPGIWRLGSSTIGRGRTIERVTWQKFRGRARHT